MENTERIRQESLGGPSEAFLQQGAESSQTESNLQVNDLSHQPQHGPQRFSRNNSLDMEAYVTSRKPRWRPRRSNKRQSNAGVDQSLTRGIDPGYMEHGMKNGSLAGRQGILTPELCVGGPSAQRD